MKKFFKGLALVLAFALIVASANGFAVKAAKKIKLNKKSVELNVNETAKVKVKNLPAGYTVKFVSKDATVATVNKKGKITAIGGGETKVVAKIKDAAGKKVANKKCAVAVAAKCEKIALNAPATAVVGAKAFANVTTTPAKTSDEIKYFVNGEEVAADYAYEKAGKYELKVTCNYNEDTATVEVTPVIVEAKDAKQKSATEFLMTMEKEVVKDDLGAATVTYDVNGAAVAVAVKELVIIPADKTQVKVVLYSAMKEETNYKLAYGKNAFEIKTASLKVKDAAGIKQTGTTVEYNETKRLPFEVVTADGVEIPYDVYSGYLTLTASDPTVAAISNSGVAKTGYTAFFYAKNTSTNVKFEYKGYYVDGTETKLNEFTENYTFQGVEKTEIPISKFEWGFDDKKEVKKLVMNETGTIRAYAEATNEYGEVDKKYGVADFTFVSSNNAVILVSGTTFTPVAVGSAQIMVYVDYNNDAKKKVVQVLDVTVDPARVPTTVTVEYSKQLLNSTQASFTSASGDAITVKFTVKDQYGAGMNSVDIKATKLSDSDSVLVAADDLGVIGTTTTIDGTAGRFDWTVDRTFVAAKDGTFSYKIIAEKTVNGAVKTSAPATVVITAKKVATGAEDDTVAFTISKNSVDTYLAKKNNLGNGLNYQTTAPQIKVEMHDVASNGYALKESIAVNGYARAKALVVSSASAAQYGFKVIKSDGSELEAPYFDKNGTSGIINAWNYSGTTVSEKLKAGTYTIQIWKYTWDTSAAENKAATMVKSFTFSVADSEFGLTVDQVKDKLASGETVKSAFEFHYVNGVLSGDKTSSNTVNGDVTYDAADLVSSSSAEFLKKVKYTVKSYNTDADGNPTTLAFQYVLKTDINVAILK